ncbi:MAG TPA: hypothetical protein PKL45_13100 [Bacteroidia bacterium]|nr:hypothetical protein [Bacteroidia bacterium]
MMTKIKSMLNTHLTKTLSIVALATMLTSCNSTAQTGSEGLSAQKKYFKNIQASILYPQGLQEIETDYSYTFTDNNDYIYIASIYVSQNIEQVKQTVIDNLSQNGFVITPTTNFTQNSNSLTTADVTVEYMGNTFPGHLIMKASGNNTYLFFGCATNAELFPVQKQNLTQMALSLQASVQTQQQAQHQTSANSISNPTSVQQYQNLLMDKVLVNNKQSRDIISTDDHTQSHGKWIASEDLSKTRRFTLCAGGFGYFRFVSTGHQMTGDYGTFELDKHSGFWRVVADAGKIGIYMEDERNGRKRFFEINDYKNNIIIIDKRPYQILTQEQSGSECLQPDGKVVVPE